jgi:hypothetical protein
MRIVVLVLLVSCTSLPVNIKTEDVVGCRSPTDDGCGTCCLATADGFAIQSAEPGADWYNISAIDDGTCPSGHPACAKCSTRDEQQLRDLSDNVVCSCEGVDTSGDPCFDAGSCACFCSRLELVQEHCSD